MTLSMIEHFYSSYFLQVVIKSILQILDCILCLDAKKSTFCGGWSPFLMGLIQKTVEK